MKKITLKKIIYQNYLKTTLTSILFIEIALIISYFYTNAVIIDKSVNYVLKDINQTVQYRTKNLTNQLNLTFSSIENNLKYLQNEHVSFFNNYSDFSIKKRVEFTFAKNGMYYKKSDNGGASVIVGRKAVVNDDLKDELQRTELFDKNLKFTVDNSDIIVAAYFNSSKNYSRYYPFLDEIYNIFPPDVTMDSYNFYYEADYKHNPLKKIVWTDVYLDPARMGWMVSAIAPIYKNKILEGVTGLDITVNKMIEKFLNMDIPYGGSSFLIDNKSNIVAINKKIADILNIETLKNHIYKDSEKISKTIFRKDKEVLSFQNDSLKSILNNIINKKEYKQEVYINGEKYLIFTQKIDKFSWSLITLIKENDILKEVKNVEKDYKLFGYMIIGFIILFYLLFFIYLYKRANDFVYLLNTPLINIGDL